MEGVLVVGNLKREEAQSRGDRERRPGVSGKAELAVFFDQLKVGAKSGDLLAALFYAGGVDYA